MMYWFTADEHYQHSNIIRYCNRPFRDVTDMNAALIANNNAVVSDCDIVIHAGDFAWGSQKYVKRFIEPLNGKHVFLRGTHDKWLSRHALIMWEKVIDCQHIVVSHYAMRTWPRSHYGSIQLHGHSHGKLPAAYNQVDIGVDCWNYYPVSLEQVLGKVIEINAKMGEGK